MIQFDEHIFSRPENHGKCKATGPNATRPYLKAVLKGLWCLVILQHRAGIGGGETLRLRLPEKPEREHERSLDVEMFLVGVSNIFYFHPYLGNDPMTNIFQMG